MNIKSPGMKWPLAGVSFAAVTIIIALISSRHRDQTPGQSSVPEAAPAAVQQQKESPAEVDARETVGVIRAYYAIGAAIDAEDFKMAGCLDRTVGYEALLECGKKTKSAIDSLASKLTRLDMPSSSCAKSLRSSYDKYIDGQLKYHEALVGWLESSRAKLLPALRSKSLFQVCGQSDKICGSRPYPFKFDAGYHLVGGIDCTKELFVCGEPDNVCHLNKVADRLGLGSGGRREQLRVRATGRRIY